MTNGPKLVTTTATVNQGRSFLVEGEGWPLEQLLFRIDEEPLSPARVLNGSLWDGLVVPDRDGRFLVAFSTKSLPAGTVVVEVQAQSGGPTARVKVTILQRSAPGPDAPREKYSKPELRREAFAARRIGDAQDWPIGQYEVFIRDWRRIHGRKGTGRGPDDGIVFFTAPIPGGCNWVPLGPSPFVHGRGSTFQDESGRVRSIAIDPGDPNRMYVGTAAGGVWRSTDGGNSWSPKSDDKFSLAIGALAVDPISTNIVYAGTGEYVPGSDYGYYYGHGLLKSTTHGDSWTEIGTTEFDLAEIARIVVHPTNPGNLFVAASNGLWQSLTGGTSWSQISPTPCTDVVLVRDPASPGVDRLVGGFQDAGIATTSRTGTGTWSAVTPVSSPAFPSGPSKRIVLGVCRDHPQRIYAVFADNTGAQLEAIAKSDDFGSSWTSCNLLPPGSSDYQSDYNLAILPHPTTPDTVILNQAHTWRSLDGGQNWTDINFGATGLGIHVDDHATCFHPTATNTFFVATDGGLFYSPDVGNSWQARNLDLSTLQLYDLGQHPQYESIMIAGSQDNGGFHYTGAPIWKRHWVAPGVTHNEMGGDGVVAQIDPFDGHVHYYGTGPEATMSRSDDSGKLFTTSWSVAPGSQWWFPFFADPRVAGVLYAGASALQRSNDRGGTWTDITGTLTGRVRAIGFQPGQPSVVFVGTTGGKVYRVTGPPSGTWSVATALTEDISLSGLPAGQEISSLAVDAAGNVWASTSSLMHTEAPGEFTTDHVHYLPAGASSWSSRSTGLAAANPINTLLIDPSDSTRVFCGGDRGAFSWNATTGSWTPWDQGLPNAPVVKMVVHEPSRKVRVATFGRGVWERSLDDVACPDHYLFVRDNLCDSGATPSPNGVPHPYIVGEHCYHWQSEDVIVDPAPFQTPALVNTPTELARGIVHLGGRRGANRVYVTVHNKGPFAVNNVRVRAFFAPASAALPPFPSGLLASPFSWTPAGSSSWNPIGAAFPIARVEAGTTRLARWEFVIPASAPRHSCLLVFVTSDEDPFDAGGITDPDLLVLNNRKVTLKNLDLDAMPTSGGGGATDLGDESTPPGMTHPAEIYMYAPQWGPSYGRPAFHGNLPGDAVVVLVADPASAEAFRPKRYEPSDHATKAVDLIRKIESLRQSSDKFDLANPIAFDYQEASLVTLDEVLIHPRKPVAVAVSVYSTGWEPNETYTLDFLQMHGDEPAGGYSLRWANVAALYDREASEAGKPIE